MENDGSVLMPDEVTQAQLDAQTEIVSSTYGTTPSEGIGNLDPLPLAQIRGDCFIADDATSNVWTIHFSNARLKQLTRSKDVSPTLGLAYYFARAMIPFLAEKKDAIEIQIAADIRRLLGSTTSHNCAYGFHLFYDVEKFDGKPEELIMNVLRTKLDLALDESNVHKMLFGAHCAYEMARKDPSMMPGIIA